MSGTERMRQQKIHPQNEILELLRLIIQQANPVRVLLRDHNLFEQRKSSATSYLPIRKLSAGPVEYEVKPWLRPGYRRRRNDQVIAQSSGQCHTRKHRIGRTHARK